MAKSDRFFQRREEEGLALTFKEVRLKTGYSKIYPEDASLETWFSGNVPLKVPVVSAAMDTITEAPFAIAIAKMGGIGVIHRNMSGEAQKQHVRQVKYHLSGIIAEPITVLESQTIQEIENMRREKNFSFYTFPVMNTAGKLSGILTQNDFDLCSNRSLQASEVMTRDLITAGTNVSLDEAYEMMLRKKKKVLPLVSDDGSLAGMYLFNDVDRIKSGASDRYNVDDVGRLRVAAAIGTREEERERVELLHEHIDAIVIDTAHADTPECARMIVWIKKNYSHLDVVAGNISEGDSAVHLAEAGADGIKVGQGPGSICTTRTVAGVGCPQVTAINSVSRALERAGFSQIPICADGGIVEPGDIPIAIGAGAHCVMLGRVFAGTEETPGEIQNYHGVQMKRYDGMGSRRALTASQSSRNRYREVGVIEDIVPEGVEGLVPYAGPLRKVLTKYLGGLRKGMAYVGASTIGELREKADFYRITTEGYRESGAHDVQVLPEGGGQREEVRNGH